MASGPSSHASFTVSEESRRYSWLSPSTLLEVGIRQFVSWLREHLSAWFGRTPGTLWTPPMRPDGGGRGYLRLARVDRVPNPIFFAISDRRLA